MGLLIYQRGRRRGGRGGIAPPLLKAGGLSPSSFSHDTHAPFLTCPPSSQLAPTPLHMYFLESHEFVYFALCKPWQEWGSVEYCNVFLSLTHTHSQCAQRFPTVLTHAVAMRLITAASSVSQTTEQREGRQLTGTSSPSANVRDNTLVQSGLLHVHTVLSRSAVLVAGCVLLPRGVP